MADENDSNSSREEVLQKPEAGEENSMLTGDASLEDDKSADESNLENAPNDGENSLNEGDIGKENSDNIDCTDASKYEDASTKCHTPMLEEDDSRQEDAPNDSDLQLLEQDLESINQVVTNDNENSLSNVVCADNNKKVESNNQTDEVSARHKENENNLDNIKNDQDVEDVEFLLEELPSVNEEYDEDIQCITNHNEIIELSDTESLNDSHDNNKNLQFWDVKLLKEYVIRQIDYATDIQNCINCMHNKLQQYKVLIGTEIQYLCSLECAVEFGGDNYTIENKPRIIYSCLGSEEFCIKCVTLSRCFYRFNENITFNYLCTRCVQEYAIKENYEICETPIIVKGRMYEQMIETPMDCNICQEKKICKFCVEEDKKSNFICSTECVDMLTSFYKRKVKLITSSFAQEYDKEPCLSPITENDKAIAQVKFKNAIQKKCLKCFKKTNNNFYYWQTNIYCSTECLEIDLNKKCRKCANCNNVVPIPNQVKYCVRIIQTIYQFCGAQCLTEYKSKAARQCFICLRKPMKRQFKSQLANASLRGLCSQECLQTYEELISTKLANGRLRKCAVCRNFSETLQRLKYDSQTFHFCSTNCFKIFKSVHDVNPVFCTMCKSYFQSRDKKPILNMFQYKKYGLFCSNICRNVYISQNIVLANCESCPIKKYNLELIVVMKDNIGVSFCSLPCVYNRYPQSNKVAMAPNITDYPTRKRKNDPPPLHYTTRPKVSRIESLADNKSVKSTPVNDQVVNHKVINNKVVNNKVVNNKVVNNKVVNNKVVNNKVVNNKVVNNKTTDNNKVVNNRTTDNNKVVNNRTTVNNKVDNNRTTVNSNTANDKTVIIIKCPDLPTPKQNVSTMCHPITKDKSIECKLEKNVRTVFIPIPVPMYVPTPMHMYSLPVPVPVPMPLPIPVPIFLPMPQPKIDEINNSIALMKQQQHHHQQQQEQQQQHVRFATDGILNSVDFVNSQTVSNNQFINSFDPPVSLDYVQGEPQLKSYFGINAWKQWATNKLSTVTNRRIFPDNPLLLSSIDLNYALCSFLWEVRKPNGTEYAPDTIYYLLLGIQQHLHQSGRVENIFLDKEYKNFIMSFDTIAIKFSSIYNDTQYIVTRVEEEHLWEASQLGPHSPITLINTLIYFNMKYFKFMTPQEHCKLTFRHILQNMKANTIGGNYNIESIRCFPRQIGLYRSGSYEIFPNFQNPSRCPVRFYQFYLLKCEQNVKQTDSIFYLEPLADCLPPNNIWYSMHTLSLDTLSRIINRCKMVKEINFALLNP